MRDQDQKGATSLPVMPEAVAKACEVVRSDAANTMQHDTTADLSARLMCRVDARKLGLVLAWVDQIAAHSPQPAAPEGREGSSTTGASAHVASQGSATATDAQRSAGMCRINFEDDGRHVDDVAISGDLIRMFRLEAMDRDQFWGAVYLRDGRDLRFWFDGSMARSLKVTAEWEGEAPSSEALSPKSEAKPSASAPATDEPTKPEGEA